MVGFFTICSVIGGTILVCQFVLTLMGLGGDHSSAGDLHGDSGGASIDHDVLSPDGHDANGHHGSTWLFGLISFRTLVAATTFFGLGGLVAESLNQNIAIQLLSGAGLGFAAMYLVHATMQLFVRLTEDGTVKIQRAIGREATVYLSIPPNRTGLGKIHISMQNGLLEYPAVTSNGEKLAAGAKVIVVDVIGTDTLEVEPVSEQIAAA